MDVSIIIINYNTPQLVIDCVNSIEKNTYGLTYEIIVVDNASQDNSIEILSQDSRIIYRYSEENLGFGKANNLGVELSSGKYLFFLNSDTILLNNVIEILLRFNEAYTGKLGGSGILLMDDERNISHSAGDFPTIKSECFRACPAIVDKFDRKSPIVDYKFVDYITGADLFIRKSIFIEIGGFDKDFFMYYEETDLQRRLSYNGYANVLLHIQGIVHLEGGSFEGRSKKTPIRRLQMQLDSRFIYMRKHLSKRKYMLFRFLYFLRSVPAVLFFRCDISSKIKYFLTLI